MSTVRPHFLKVMESAMAKISWPAFQTAQHAPACPHTLVHGDFHPWNIICAGERMVLLDWEMVGVGSGPQDLGQFMLNLDPLFRQQHERQLVEGYHACLTTHMDTPPSWEACWCEYCFGAAEHWVWMFPFLAAMPDRAVQFFHDQLDSFFRDHAITEANIGQPRP
eukprot:NODE_3931_length_872_cov_6.479195_g3776_i0.p2 GENE.NODE_3931_length_872_cov_6.479195_g3776_i0~~NODE_3931_length_872_cov_6.479195_g3776_i0.p2  ORF type:complete len:165 (-),score=42.02 NODE_3931_length_872_cov_6.479195_g3776_i0:72-566(-)